MKIVFGENKKKELDMFDNNDVEIPIGPQFNKEVEINPTGRNKRLVQILAYFLSIVVILIIIIMFVLK